MNKEILKKKLAIKRLDHVYCRIQPSIINGVGLFAIRDIEIGIDPFNNSYMGHDNFLINKNEIKNQPDEIKKLLEDYWPSNNNSEIIMPYYPNQIILTNYLNYTDKEPNIIFNDNGKWETIKFIKKGEELLENPNLLFNKDGSYKLKNVTKTNYLQLSSINLKTF
jgi:CRISPR/Cas system CMR-associated protein Cmr5 small subunit